MPPHHPRPPLLTAPAGREVAQAATGDLTPRGPAAAARPVIGLTGGIGSGKSAVARLLAERGAAVVDADAAAHQVYRAGTAGWKEIVAAFGREILDAAGAISRRKLGAIVFHDAGARARLNAIVHPQVRRSLREQAARLQRRGVAAVVVEVPLLVEAIRNEPGWRRMFDEIWVVTAPEAQVIERVRARGSMSEATIRAVIAAQLTPEQRLPYADVVIDNRGSMEQLRSRVAQLWRARLDTAPEAEPPTRSRST